MKNLPISIDIFFILITFLTIWIFYKATKKSTATIIILLSWISLQAVIALTGFYTVINAIPPRFPFLIIPPALFILLLFLFKKGRIYIDALNTKWLTILQSVRIFVELLLLCLFLNNRIPKIMTFEGRNFDILAGLTAPVIFYFGYVKNNISRNLLLAWNLICLVLVINILILAIFSAPFPFQHFGFEQPNIAIFYFPFIWLPCCVVPLVILSHLATIRQLLLNRDHLSNSLAA
jgi:hypothetical protein